MNFVAFDLETTGTVAGVDRIVEIGAVKFINGQPDGVYSTLVDPLRPIPPGASRVNGISNEMVDGKPTIDQLLDSFSEFCEDYSLVAHNAPFDFQFLMAAIKREQGAAPRGVVLDTLPMARKLMPGLPNYKLGTLVKHLNIPTTQFHRAEEDASYCGYLYLHLLKKMGASQEAPPIENLVALTGRAELRFPQIERVPTQLSLL